MSSVMNIMQESENLKAFSGWLSAIWSC